MPPQFRLIAQTGPETPEVSFRVAWAAAPALEMEPLCAAARLDTGDGHLIDLGLLCAPSAVTWCAQRQVDLADYSYDSAGPFTARLHWGDAVAEVVVTPGRPGVLAAKAALPADTLPTVALLAIAPMKEQPMQRFIKLRVEGLVAGQILRLDCGAGQVYGFSIADSAAQENEAGTEIGVAYAKYAKPGPYVIMLDLLDADGFWLATLAQNPIAITYPDETLSVDTPAPSAAELSVEPSETAPVELLAEPQPWLPYRYIKPRYNVSTYASPGGGAVRRNVNPGIFLSVRAETMVGGQVWYKTAYGDWIAASAVTFFQVSALRGIELGDTPPPPRRHRRHRLPICAGGSSPPRY